MEPVAISDGHALANGGTLPGSSPPPAADSLPGGRACADASGSALRLREVGAEATNPALTELAAVAADGGAPADGGSPKGADLALAADSAPGECLSVACYRLLHHTAVSFVSSDIRVFLYNFYGSDTLLPRGFLPPPRLGLENTD